MKRADIPNMTARQCADELTLLEVKKLLQKARKASQKAEELQQAVFRSLEDMCIDMDTHSEAEDAETLEEAVTCYLGYGEFGLKNIMREIRAQYLKDGEHA